MKELIKITKNEEGQQLVSARELHKFLEIKRYFTQWIEPYIKLDNEYKFLENVDFTRINVGVNPTNGVPIKDIALTMDMAKELSMLSKSDKGRQARKYFIKCEEKLKEELKNRELTETDKIVKLASIVNSEQRAEFILKLVDKFYSTENSKSSKKDKPKIDLKQKAIDIFKECYDEAYICNKGCYVVLDKKIVYKKAYSKGISKREFNKIVIENEMVRSCSNGGNVSATITDSINGIRQRQFFVNKTLFSL